MHHQCAGARSPRCCPGRPLLQCSSRLTASPVLARSTTPSPAPVWHTLCTDTDAFNKKRGSGTRADAAQGKPPGGAEPGSPGHARPTSTPRSHCPAVCTPETKAGRPGCGGEKEELHPRELLLSLRTTFINYLRLPATTRLPIAPLRLSWLAPSACHFPAGCFPASLPSASRGASAMSG